MQLNGKPINQERKKMDSASIKRQILSQSDTTGIRKEIIKNYEGGIGQDDILEMGAAFETLVSTRAWAYIEAYCISRSNPIGLLFAKRDDIEVGKAQALVGLLQYVEQIITARREIIARTKVAPKDDSSRSD